ncbi:MAG: formate transporter FocA [Omnitrophica WOR_2 bacterium RIFCSPLOWO2_01_FULL_41_12]|nr:MAG: formate transporter FocA [Omnitrophica WOR_2 bacterium RIFCSPLOWO2_01_FULL_41_12]
MPELIATEIKFDAYSPKEIASRIETVGVGKANLNFWAKFTLAMLAGVFIAFGAVLFTFVVHDSRLSFGLTQLIGGLTFCLGLILVVLAGAELFTGNNLLVMAFVSKKITLRQLLINWIIVYFGNFVGAFSIVLWIYLTRQWNTNNNLVGAKALLIANAKVGLPFLVAFSRGVLCNALVCLAVWLCMSGRSTTDKILSIIFPITAFVALGFEHSIANMYFIPAGILLKNNPAVLEAAASMAGKVNDFSNLTLHGLLVKNLLPVTLGNIIGGGVLVGLVYWFVYLRGKTEGR